MAGSSLGLMRVPSQEAPGPSHGFPGWGLPVGDPSQAPLVQKAEVGRNQAFQTSGKASDWSFDLSIDLPRVVREEHWRKPQAHP